jgi:hypothetical protein
MSDYQKLYYEIHKEKILARGKATYERNKEKLKPVRQAWAKANRDKLNEQARARGQKARANLEDSYVKRMIRSQTGLKFKDITAEMIEKKRAEVIIKRALDGKELPEVMTKCCTICNEVKPILAFKKDANVKGGRVNQCRACLNAKQNARRWAVKPPKVREVFPEGYKRCNKCKEIKPLDKFGHRIRGYLSRNSECKVCMYERTRQWAKNNPEKVKLARKREQAKNAERYKKYYEQYYSDPQNKKHKEQYRKRYYQLTAEKAKQRAKEYVLNNPEKVKEKNREWRQLNKEWLNELNRKQIADLSDKYVKTLLFKGKVSKVDIPQELIEAKRLEVLIKRRLKDEDSNRTT